MKALLAVFVGGGSGSLLRYGIGLLVGHFHRGVFPLATLLSNVLSCGVLALILGLLAKTPSPTLHWKALLVVGFCGGLSTFSTLSYESLQLLKAGHWEWMTLNLVSSLGLCLLILHLLGGKFL
jgi:CrcB protein